MRGNRPCTVVDVFHAARRVANFHSPFAAPVSGAEITVVMRHNYYCFAGAFEFRQKRFIEITAKMRVLVGRHFIENINRLVLQIGNDQRQTLALAG